MSSGNSLCPTKSPTTIQSYFKRAENLKKAAQKELGLNPSVKPNPRQMVGWLLGNQKKYSSATWRQYKSAVLCAYENELDLLDERINPMPWIEAIELLKSTDNHNQPIAKSTSAKKLKKINPKDLDKLLSVLEHSKTQVSQSLILWIKCGLWTGLRPGEWETTEIVKVGESEALLVHNAKNTNGRSHGITRTVILNKCSEEEIAIIKTHVNQVKKWHSAGVYRNMYHACISKLYETTRKIWPNRERHITLYSTRHQFVANAKAANLSLAQVAALMGHAVDDTATTHYGRRAAGQEELKVSPLPSEVLKIKKVFKGFHQSAKPQPEKLTQDPAPQIL